jgi:hypothetical protein
MTTSATGNEKIVSRFLKMIESRKSTSDLARYYHPDVLQVSKCRHEEHNGTSVSRLKK